MTSTLGRQRLQQSARDWAEIQERMLVPLYEAVYERLGVGESTRLLGLDCGSGLALLLAAARGARVVGTDTDEARLALARARLAPEPQWGGRPWSVQLLPGDPGQLPEGRYYSLVTAFDRCPSPAALAAAAARTERGSPVILACPDPAEPAAVPTGLLPAGARYGPASGGDRTGGRAELERVVRLAGLRPADAGRVTCPFGYPDVDSAVRGLLSTGRYRPAVLAVDEEQVGRELAEALRARARPDGTVWLPNRFHYVVAHV